LLTFIVVMAALLIILVVVISKMPDSNPLKRLLTALSYRLGATLAAGAVAIPLEPIPGIDALYDIGAPIALIWYWFTFFRDARRMKSAPICGQAASKSRGTIDEELNERQGSSFARTANPENTFLACSRPPASRSAITPEVVSIGSRRGWAAAGDWWRMIRQWRRNLGRPKTLVIRAY
jgi:hypothetical protein